MGNNLADFIERCILGKFVDEAEHILMRRNDLAVELECAPSQISYVLNTRFTLERGFIVESRRGAGGFVRIVRVTPVVYAKNEPTHDAFYILNHLLEKKAVSSREYALLKYLLEFSVDYVDEEEHVELLYDALKNMDGI